MFAKLIHFLQLALSKMSIRQYNKTWPWLWLFAAVHTRAGTDFLFCSASVSAYHGDKCDTRAQIPYYIDFSSIGGR